MDRAVVERAVKALAAVNEGRGTESRSTPLASRGRESRNAVVRASVTQAQESGREKVAACGSPHCAGCYEVAPGVRIHPPKCGEEYGKWLERWEPKEKVQ